MSFFGINGVEALILLVLAALILGPEQIIAALGKFRALVTRLQGYSQRLREFQQQEVAIHDPQMQELQELRAQVDALQGLTKGLDLQDLDPRRVIREAVHQEMQAWSQQWQQDNKKRPESGQNSGSGKKEI